MHSRIQYLGAALLLLGCVTLSPGIFAAQKAKAPARASKAAQESKPPDTDDKDQDYSIAVQVQVVTVPVTVTDRKNQFVTNLDKREFTVLDNGEPQKIENFELSAAPLSLAILVETSSGVQPLMPQLRGMGILITQLLLGESGEAAVLNFDREVNLAQDFTTNPDEVEAALRKLPMGASQVRLNDAVARAVFLLQRRPAGRRKVILIVSEAKDRGSSSKLGSVLRGAQQLGISVYTVGLSTMKALLERPGDQASRSSPYPPGVLSRPLAGGALPTPDVQSNMGAANVNVLEIVSDLVTYAKNLIGGNPLSIYAAGTGAVDFPSDSQAKLERAVSRIGEELRNQYLLTYHPSNTSDFGYHTIKVSVSRNNLDTRFRLGYVLLPAMQGKPSSPQPPPASSEEPAPAAQ